MLKENNTHFCNENFTDYATDQHMNGYVNGYRDEPTFSWKGDTVVAINYLYVNIRLRDYIFYLLS